MKTIFKSALFCLSLIISMSTMAQNEGEDTSTQKQKYQITKNDNSAYIGIILSDDGREVLIETENLGKIYIQKSDIKSIKKVEGDVKIIHGEASIFNSFATRYSFTTNALPIKKGENYSMVNLYGPEVHFALTDHLSLGVMSTWIASPVVLAAKFSQKTTQEKVNVSVGALMGTSSYIGNFRGFGTLLFGNITLGDREKNLTLAGGYAYLKQGRIIDKAHEGFFNYTGYYHDNNSGIWYEGNPEPIKGPVFSIAGIMKVGAKASLVLDGMLGFFSQDDIHTKIVTIKEPVYPDYKGEYAVTNTKVTNQYLALFIMPGMRFQTTDRKAFQVSLAGVSITEKKKGLPNYSYSFPLPMVTWFRNF